MPTHKKFAFLTGFLLALFVAGWHLNLWSVQTAFAQLPGAPRPGAPGVPGGAFGPEPGLSGTTIQGMILIARFVLVIINFLTWIIFFFLDVIMDPEWIFDLKSTNVDGDLVSILREVWQLCRDLVNLFLGAMLIAGAIQMIITADTSKVKEKLPKFVVALVLVNFSWFLPRAIFDASQVLTYTAYQVPSLLGADGCTLPPIDPNSVERRPCEIVTRMAFFEQATIGVTPDGINTLDNNSPGWKCPIVGLLCYQSLPINAPGADAQPRSKVLNGLIVNHARLGTLTSMIDPRFLSGVGPLASDNVVQAFLKLLSLFAKLIMVVMLNAALFFPILAMAFAFFLRIPVLWVTMALMPLVALAYALGGEKLKDFNPMETILKQFLNAVFLPVRVAVPFTIGFIMLNAGAQSAPPDAFAGLAPISLLAGVRDFWQLLWMAIALFIIWKYSFKALSSDGDNITGMFTERIKNLGTSLGQIAYRYPLSFPVVPIPGAGNISPLQAARGLSPSNIARELQLGSQQSAADAIRRNLGIPERGRRLPAQADQRKATDVYRTDVAVKGRVDSHVDVILRQDFTKAAEKDAAKGDLEKLIKAVRDKNPAQFKEVTDRDIVEGIIEALGTAKTDDQKKKLREAIELLSGKGSAKG